MVRCADFYERWKKDPNWCQKSPDTVNQIDHYLGLVGELENLGVETVAIYKKFPERVARDILKIKDDKIRAGVIGNAAGMIKRGDQVSSADVKVWAGLEEKSQKLTSNSDVRTPTMVGNRSPKTEEKTEITDVPSAPIAGDLKKKYTPPENKPAPTPESIPPVVSPCDDGLKCDLKYFKNEIIRGKVCTNANMRITELPGNICPFESDLRKRKEAAAEAEEFVPASDIDPITGGRPIKLAPIKIVKKPESILFEPTPKQWEFIEQAITSGKFDTPQQVLGQALDLWMEQEGL